MDKMITSILDSGICMNGNTLVLPGVCIIDIGSNSDSVAVSHSQMEQYFFSYLLTWEVDLIEILEIMTQMWQYVIFLSLKPTKVTSDYIFC